MAPDLPTDGLFSSQYHLRNTAAGQRDLAVFRGDTSVWDDYTGAGVLVGVIDDGIDKTHVDLNDNYNAALETVNGSHPAAADAHGTAVSGIIAAERNGVGVVGVAYDAQITMMAAISGSPNITLEASLDNAKNFDVINNSWGFTTPWGDQKFNPSFATFYNELNDVSLLGRGGLGSVFVKSAGNGREADGFFDDNVDNSNFSYTNAHFASVTVAAVLRTGFVSSYSTEGAANLVSAFGGPTSATATSRRSWPRRPGTPARPSAAQ
jgi:subtilisin family serine protease